MPSTNSDSVIWSVGDTTGRDASGASAAIPGGFVVSTATTAPTAAPEGTPFYLADEDLYLWNGSAWVGPYTVA